MAKLIGKAVGDKVVEFYGPIDGRNYNTRGGTAVPPRISVQVFGDGEVQVEQTQTYILKGNAGTNNFTHDKLPDQTTFAPLGATVNAAAGRVDLAPTVDNFFSAIRVVVTTVGDGRVVVETDWN